MADYVSMARPFIVEPDMVNKFKAEIQVSSECLECGHCILALEEMPVECFYGEVPYNNIQGYNMNYLENLDKVLQKGDSKNVEKFAVAANDDAVNIIAMSALLTTTLPKMYIPYRTRIDSKSRTKESDSI